jgi:two-component system, cell cycle sensor histidine kinase and response regulator CckA
MSDDDRTRGFQRLAGGLAHDFNNLFMAISGNVELLKMDLPAGSMGLDCLEDIAEATRRGVERCNEMMVYANRRPVHTEPLDLGQLASDRVEQARGRAPDTVGIDLTVSDCLPTTAADPTRVTPLLDALLDNALAALDGGGTLTVVVDRDADGTFVRVQDDGPGMDEDTRRHMFDPYFSTSDHGRGLGLAWLVGVMEVHRGTVDVRTAPGEGTTVQLNFP